MCWKVYSARFGGVGATDSERVEKLLAAISDRNERNRTARYVCAMAIARPAETGELLTMVEERCEGSLTLRPRGDGGFGYDPIFVPAGYSQTLGELPGELKSKISHRGKALSLIRNFLDTQFGQT